MTTTTGRAPAGPRPAAAELADTLRQAYRAIGKPTLKALGKRIGYSPTHLSRVLSGKSVPSPDLMSELGRNLGVSPQTFTTVWRPLWIAARDEARREPAEPATAGEECGTCGVWAANPQGHADWHARNDRPALQSVKP